ncbi:plasmid replication protein, CyRepA1 family [Iningainema tapete]|uniref:plasmid replication protein, CyRepA1 family n=1 Tax=Iningainema tapete TaxID=2806730 RepID=UPI001EE230D8|nr:plasmid replication protein, CyRepA1 family [Iningainema tapete]
MNDNSPVQHPNNLTAAEYHELAISSAIHPALIERNFIHIAGEIVYIYLFISGVIPRKNAGRVTDGFLNQYRHAADGGLWISGLDPQNNWQPMEWGRFKPTNPRIDAEKGKPVKYESPPKTPNRVTYFDVPDCIWDLVAQRYNIKRYHSPLALRLQDRLHPLNFWEWVQRHPEIPVILCEGEKKAACLLSLGFVAIALPGIWNGRVGKKDFDERLHPDLLPLARHGRKFIILFDYETKLKTRWSVFQATVRTGKTIEAVGCICEVALLPGPEKGVDDFVVARGKEAHSLLTAIIDDAKTLGDYQRAYHQKRRGLSNKYTPHITVNVKYLSEAVRLPQSGLVVLCSDMGTGKTELMRRWRDEHPDGRFLNNGHRVNLLKNLALRLQTEMYSDLGYTGLAKATALSITIDSLHKLNTQALTYGCVFIDEACQYLTHLLHSKTCKEHRAAILEVLEYIVYNAPLVVIADAHMDDVTVNFFRAMRPPGEEPFIIKNEWKNGDRPIYWYEGDDSSASVAQISSALMAGLKIMVVSDSKRFVKKLEQSLTVQVRVDDKDTDSGEQRLRVWSIHSDNSGSEENVAFIKDITNAVKGLDALLTSPSLGTGVDIPEYHFDAVFGVFHGISQTATECAQQLYRYRPKVPIHVWVAPRPPFGYQDTNASKIKERLLQTNEMTAFLLRIDRETGRRGAEKDWALDAYVHIMATRHQSINNLRTDLRDLLTEMGNQIIPMGDLSDKLAQERLKNAAIALDTAYYAAVALANNITASEYRLRQSKDYHSPEEVYECEKFRIQDAYGMEVTESLVEKDNGGRLIRAIVNLEAILSEPDGVIKDSRTGLQYPAPPTIVAEKDRSERFHLPLCMDWGNYSASWLARFNLGLRDILKRLISGSEITATDPELLRMTERAKYCAPHVKAILGFTVPSNCQPIWLLGVLLDQLGLKLVDRKIGPRGKQVKHFSLLESELNFAMSVIAHRSRKRAEKEERARTAAESQQRYQAGLQSQYGVAPTDSPVSTPPHNGIGEPLGEEVDTKVENIDFEHFGPEDG